MIRRALQRLGVGRGTPAAMDPIRPVDRDREMDAIALYHRTRADAAEPALDDWTWSDLDLDAVFAWVDRCASAPGRQVLYDRLRRPSRTLEPLQRFDALVRALTGSGERRHALRATLRRLDAPNALLLPQLFATSLPRAFRAPWLHLLQTALAALLVVGCFFWPRLLLPLAAVLLLNAVVQLVHRKRVAQYVAPLGMVSTLLSVAEALLAKGGGLVRDSFPSLTGDLVTLAPLRRRCRWLLRDVQSGDDLGGILVGYLNAFFLLDLNALSFSLQALQTHADTLARTFQAVGELDAALAVGWVREGSPYPAPKLGAAEALEVVDLVHPLVEGAVPNSVTLEGSALITGSNMSGKSTFLRAVGVNAVLAQTLFFTCATRWRAPLLQVMSSIGTRDDLLQGKSYYLAEVERIRTVLQADGPTPRLVLIDELFRGTNTVERVAGGCAVLRALQRKPGFVLVATHDLELVDLLGMAFRPFHFRELIEDGAMRFDYRLQEGTSSTRNALALLELLGFPAEVVADARAVADRDGAVPRPRETG